jgi:hypothetical protein
MPTPAPADAPDRGAARMSSWADWLRRVRPAYLLAPLVLVQLGIAVALALSVKHNGWLWYSGGDATEYWSEEWSLAHGLLPHTFLGVGVPALYAWVPLVTGQTLLQGLPPILVLQVLIGVPLAVVGIWMLADRIAGRLFAWWTTLLWIVGPLLFMQGFRPDYRPEFKSNFLVPQWYGLTNMGDFPSIVLVIWAAWASCRAFDSRRLDDAVLAGALVGALVAVKPSNAIFAGVPLVCLLLLRRWRQAGVAVASALPSVLVLTLWKERGVGTIPVLAVGDSRREAGGATVGAIGISNHYAHIDWAQLSSSLDQIREVFWSVRLLEYLALAGAIALMRRSPVKGLFVVAWFAGYILVKGSSPLAEVPATSFWRLTVPGLVAFVLLAAAVPLLAPRGRRGPASPVAAPEPAPRRTVLTIGLVGALFVLLPLAAVAVASPMTTPRVVRYTDNTEAPISSALGLTTATDGAGVRLGWRRPPSGRSTVWFAVMRSRTGDGCTFYPEGARECLLDMPNVTTTQSLTYVDRPGPGRWWYRVAMVGSADASVAGGDLMLISPPETISVG